MPIRPPPAEPEILSKNISHYLDLGSGLRMKLGKNQPKNAHFRCHHGLNIKIKWNHKNSKTRILLARDYGMIGQFFRFSSKNA